MLPRIVIGMHQDTFFQNLRQTVMGEKMVAATASTVTELLDLFRKPNITLAALVDFDLWRRAGSGFQQLARHFPIVLIGEPNRELSLERGLADGAVDYLVRSTSMPVVQAKLRAHIRSYQWAKGTIFRIGGSIYVPSSKLVYDPLRQRTVRLTPKEAALLQYLRDAQGAPVCKRELLTAIWGLHEQTTTYTIETHIARLRKKLEPVPVRPKFLINENGSYRLCYAELWSDKPGSSEFMLTTKQALSLVA